MKKTKMLNPFAAPKGIPGVTTKMMVTKGKGIGVKTTTLRSNSPMLDAAGKKLFGK